MRSFLLSLCLLFSAVICSTYATAASSGHCWNAYKQKELFLANDSTTKPAPEKDILVKEITTVKIKGSSYSTVAGPIGWISTLRMLIY